MELNQKLSELRKSKGLTQQELAEALNVSRQTVSRWEVGTAAPTLDNMVYLSELYHVPLDEFVRDSEPKAAEAVSPIASAGAGRPRAAFISTILAVLILGVGILIGLSLKKEPSKEAYPQIVENGQITVGWLEKTPADVADELEWQEAAVKDVEEQPLP